MNLLHRITQSYKFNNKNDLVCTWRDFNKTSCGISTYHKLGVKGVTHAHLAPIWYHSEPSNVPYYTRQCLGWDLCLLFLTANGSNMCCFYAVKTRQLQKFPQIYFLNFLHFLDVHFKSFIYLIDLKGRPNLSNRPTQPNSLVPPYAFKCLINV